MSINVPCRDCGRQYHVADSLAGKTFRCKSCGGAVAARADDDFYEDDRPQPTASEFDDIPNPYGPGGKTSAGQNRRPSKSSKPAQPSNPVVMAIVAAIGIAGVAFLAIVVALAGRAQRKRPFAAVRNPKAPVVADFSGEWNAADVTLRTFPELGPAQSIDGSAVKLYEVDFARVPQDQNAPAARMKLRVYLPTGDLAEKSLPIVLVAPAGTPLIHGSDIDDGDYYDETLPYAEAGMCAVHYSLDGPDDGESGGVRTVAAYKEFARAQAGVLNARHALEFALARIPAADPRRIYAAGHSSAATLALLTAAHEPRIAACVAYAPCTDVVKLNQEILANPVARALLPGIREFLAKSSPTSHLAGIRCPTFLFYSEDDAVTPLEENRPFVTGLEARNPQTTVVTVAEGAHYESMIDEGIPRAIAWLKEKNPALPGAAPAAAAAAN